MKRGVEPCFGIRSPIDEKSARNFQFLSFPAHFSRLDGGISMGLCYDSLDHGDGQSSWSYAHEPMTTTSNSDAVLDDSRLTLMIMHFIFCWISFHGLSNFWAKSRNEEAIFY